MRMPIAYVIVFSVIFANLLVFPIQQANAQSNSEIGNASVNSATARNQFKHLAITSGLTLDNMAAQAYFKGPHYIQWCFNRENVIACRVLGPMKMLFIYEDDEKYYELGAGQQAFCYAGRQGIFCDIYH